jgi:GH43 family beta-xylosidase
VVQAEGSYYLCQSYGRGVWVTKSASLELLGRAQAVKVWTPPRGTNYSREVWAPELHQLRGRWYVYVAADDGDNAHHRMFVLQGEAKDPQQPFEFKGKLNLPEDRWAIDGTVLELSNKLYFVWSGWPGNENVTQNLYIAPMSDPLTICGTRVCLSVPDRHWEQHGRPLVNEGPEVLRHGDKLFIIYSASGSWGDDYCLGQLTFTGTEPMDPKAWTKKPAAVFTRTANVFGPGHCSFVKSPDGKEDWIVYHAAKYSGAGWNRNIRIQRFGWDANGSPDFGLPAATGVPLEAPGGTAGP